MKILPILILLSISVFAQSYQIDQIDQMIIDLDIDSLIEIELDNARNVDLKTMAKSYVTSIDIKNYIDGLSYLKPRLKDIESIKKVKIFEFYDWHSPYQTIYFLITDNNDKIYFSKYDVRRQIYNDLGCIKEDYFSSFLTLSKSNFRQGDGSSYISILEINSFAHLKIDIYVNNDIWDHNMFFMIEKIINQE